MVLSTTPKQRTKHLVPSLSYGYKAAFMPTFWREKILDLLEKTEVT